MGKKTIAGGAVVGEQSSAEVALSPAATVSLDCTAGNVFTLTPGQDETINAANVQNDQVYHLVITTSGSTSRTLTFGTNFKTTGTLATGTTTAKVFVLEFLAQGGILIEVSRTTAM